MILEQPWSLHFETESLLALTHLGLVSTGMAFLMRYYIILRAGAVFLSYVAFIIPMFGILFGILFLGETISANTTTAPNARPFTKPLRILQNILRASRYAHLGLTVRMFAREFFG